MIDRIFNIEGKWALGADRLQWIVYKRAGNDWRSLSFVSSSRDILARCLSEKGCDAHTARILLAGLPSTFKEWKSAVGRL